MRWLWSSHILPSSSSFSPYQYSWGHHFGIIPFEEFKVGKILLKYCTWSRGKNSFTLFFCFEELKYTLCYFLPWNLSALVPFSPNFSILFCLKILLTTNYLKKVSEKGSFDWWSLFQELLFLKWLKDVFRKWRCTSQSKFNACDF